MQDLIITLVQTDLYWGERDRNLAMFEGLLRDIPRSDLVLLPEMFNTGFMTIPAPVAEPPGGPTMQWMDRTARSLEREVAGTIITEDSGRYYNRMIWMRPDGSYARSDKRHLFSLGGEDRQFTRGTERTIVEIRGWKVLPLICYDMRFPAWSRNNFKDGSYDYDLVLYLSNWPEVRNHAWKILLPARAIENQAYVVGLNRIGKDGHGKSHSGDSSVIDPGGVMVESLPPHQSAVCTVTLKARALLDLRSEFPQGADMDRFTVL